MFSTVRSQAVVTKSCDRDIESLQPNISFAITFMLKNHKKVTFGSAKCVSIITCIDHKDYYSTIFQILIQKSLIHQGDANFHKNATLSEG